MLKLNALIISAIILLSWSIPGFSQEKANITIAGVKEKGGEVHFSLKASRPFIFGNNRYILHIGTSDFTRNEQSTHEGKGDMIFFIPAAEYRSLQEDAPMYLTYGTLRVNADNLQAVSKENYTPCWSLGKFTTSLLTK